MKFLCPIKTFYLSKKEFHIWIQQKTNNFGGLFMGHWNVFGTPDICVITPSQAKRVVISLSLWRWITWPATRPQTTSALVIGSSNPRCLANGCSAKPWTTSALLDPSLSPKMKSQVSLFYNGWLKKVSKAVFTFKSKH